MWIGGSVYVKNSMRLLCSTAAVRFWRHDCMVDEEHGVFVRGVDEGVLTSHANPIMHTRLCSSVSGRIDFDGMVSSTANTSPLYRQCAFETVYCCCLHRTHFRRTQNMLSTPYALGLQYHRALQASFTIDFARYALLRACRHDVVAVSATCTARLHNPRRTCAAPALQMWLNVSPSKTSGPMDLLRRVLCCLCESVLEAMVVVVVGLDRRRSVCV
jgi:hypothetical protein